MRGVRLRELLRIGSGVGPGPLFAPDQVFPKKQSAAEQPAIFSICCRLAGFPSNRQFSEPSRVNEEPAIDLKGIQSEVAGSGLAGLKARFRNDM